MKYTYYPGCSLKSTEIGYENSLRASSEILGIELKELPEWNCCGATIFPKLNYKSYLLLSTRNLALAESYGEDLVTACNGCLTALNKVNFYLQNNRDILEKINGVLGKSGLNYQGKIKIRHFLEVLVKDIGKKIIGEKIKKGIHGIKVASYYGCQYSRPFGPEHPENPQYLENLLEILGAEIVDFSHKTNCCGGILTISEESCLKLIKDILEEAENSKVDCIVTICPLCEINLQLYQKRIKIFIPVVYFTQLLGYSLGIEISKLGKEIFSLKKLLK